MLQQPGALSQHAGAGQRGAGGELEGHRGELEVLERLFRTRLRAAQPQAYDEAAESY